MSIELTVQPVFIAVPLTRLSWIQTYPLVVADLLLLALFCVCGRESDANRKGNLIWLLLVICCHVENIIDFEGQGPSPRGAVVMEAHVSLEFTGLHSKLIEQINLFQVHFKYVHPIR